LLILKFIFLQLHLTGNEIRSIFLQENLTDLFRLLKWQKLKPNISTRVSLSEVGIAQTKIEKTQLKGLVVCLPWKRMTLNNDGSKKVQARYKIGNKAKAMFSKKS
jgi:hypothetical protein